MFYTFEECHDWGNLENTPVAEGKPYRIKAKSEERARRKLPKIGAFRKWVLTATENTHGLHSNIENYLETRGGSVMDFYNYKAAGQRIPQAFFNALSENDQGRLRGTDQDPFFKDGYGPVEIAVAWLLETEDR